MRTRFAVGAVVTAALLAGALTVTLVLPALAQDGGDEAGSQITKDRPGRYPFVTGGAFAEALAQKLDLPADEVATAIDEVLAEWRTQAREAHPRGFGEGRGSGARRGHWGGHGGPGGWWKGPDDAA